MKQNLVSGPSPSQITGTHDQLRQTLVEEDPELVVVIDRIVQNVLENLLRNQRETTSTSLLSEQDDSYVESPAVAGSPQ